MCVRLTAEPAGAQRHEVNRLALVTINCQSRDRQCTVEEKGPHKCASKVSNLKCPIVTLLAS